MNNSIDDQNFRVILGLDYGTRRIGGAVGQRLTGTGQPIGTLPCSGQPNWEGIERWIREWRPDALVVGIPYHTDGTESQTTAQVRAFARELERRFSLPVRCVDECLSSFCAEREIQVGRESGLRRKTRKGDVDALAARMIVETYLNSTARTSE